MATKDNIYEVICELVRNIPVGRVTTYGAVANALGLKNGARMVGYALNNCGSKVPAVPAHRVVNSVGILSARHQFEPGQMQFKLEKEGVKIKNDSVVDFRELFWDPMQELR